MDNVQVFVNERVIISILRKYCPVILKWIPYGKLLKIARSILAKIARFFNIRSQVITEKTQIGKEVDSKFVIETINP